MLVGPFELSTSSDCVEFDILLNLLHSEFGVNALALHCKAVFFAHMLLVGLQHISACQIPIAVQHCSRICFKKPFLFLLYMPVLFAVIYSLTCKSRLTHHPLSNTVSCVEVNVCNNCRYLEQLPVVQSLCHISIWLQHLYRLAAHFYHEEHCLPWQDQHVKHSDLCIVSWNHWVLSCHAFAWTGCLYWSVLKLKYIIYLVYFTYMLSSWCTLSILLLLLSKVKVEKSRAVNGTPSQSYGVSLALWDHTLLPSTQHKWTHPTLTPAR